MEQGKFLGIYWELIFDWIREWAALSGRYENCVAVIVIGMIFFLSMKIINIFLVRLDFVCATFFRRRNMSPPVVQFWLGNFFRRAPRVIVLITIAVTLLVWVRDELGHLQQTSLNSSFILTQIRESRPQIVNYVWNS